MDEKTAKIGIAIIDLGEAIQNNNLEQAKSLVDFINKNYDQSEGFALTDCLDFSMFFDKGNETFEYVIFHIDNYYNIQGIQWRYQIKKIIDNYLKEKNSSSKQIIKQFIINNLQNNLDSQQYNDLIRLAYTIQDLSLLPLIKEKLNDFLIK